jgi:hypothetical protein
MSVMEKFKILDEKNYPEASVDPLIKRIPGWMGYVLLVYLIFNDNALFPVLVYVGAAPYM